MNNFLVCSWVKASVTKYTNSYHYLLHVNFLKSCLYV